MEVLPEQLSLPHILTVACRKVGLEDHEKTDRFCTKASSMRFSDTFPVIGVWEGIVHSLRILFCHISLHNRNHFHDIVD